MTTPITLGPYGTPGAWTPGNRPYQGGHTTLRPSNVRDNGPGVDLVLGPSSASGGVTGAESFSISPTFTPSDDDLADAAAVRRSLRLERR